MKFPINSFCKKMLLSIFLFSLSLSAQTNSYLLDGKQYVKDNGKWYVIDSKTELKYLLDETSLSVKLKEGFSKQAFENYCKALGIEIERENMIGIIDLKLPETANIFGTYNQFKNSAMFEWIDINSYGEFLTGFYPNDYAFDNDEQYYLDDESGDININVNEAWEIIYGNNISPANIIVAVIDQGVDYNHGDLAGNIWTNSQNYHGYDFYDNDDFPLPLTDDHHGTGIAGIIAAKTNNNNGIASVAGGWNGSISGAKIMALRVGYGTYVDASVVDDAIIYAANNGAKILNLSFATDELNAIKNAIEYASAQKGCLLIAAGGNALPGLDPKGIKFPARHNMVMAVGGVTRTGGKYGDWGPEKEIVAPATEIVALLNSTINDPYRYGLFDLTGKGTSASAPQAAGAAVLLWAVYPELLNLDVRKALIQSAFDIGDPGFDEDYGYGLLDITGAILELNLSGGSFPPQPQNLTISIVSQRAKLDWTSVNGVNKYYVYRAVSTIGKYGLEKVAEVNHPTTTWTDYSYYATFNPSTPSTPWYFYRVTAVNNDGKESILSNEVSVSRDFIEKQTADESLNFSYKLEDNYPNPFNPSTTINYELAEDTKVVLKIYDILGREIAELVNEKKSAGFHKVNFNASHLPSGIYMYRIKTEHYSDSKKMLLLK